MHSGRRTWQRAHLDCVSGRHGAGRAVARRTRSARCRIPRHRFGSGGESRRLETRVMNTTLATSVIIPTRNRPQLLADTVASLLRGDTLPAEIVVVDQSDHMVARTEHERGCCIRYVPCADRGLSRARNTGANLARHEALVFVDDDMTADPQWLRALVDALLAAGEDDAVTGRVLAGPQEVADGFVPALARRTVPAARKRGYES